VGWRPIKDISDPHILEIGRWAVAEHARGADDGLQFVRVTRGKSQMVAGTNYRLVLEAKDANGATAAYDVFVYEVWTGTRELMSFSRH
jgi:hypothetical protein